MRPLFFLFLIVCLFNSIAQQPLYDFIYLKKTQLLPISLCNQRSVVIFSVPVEKGEYDKAGEYKKFINEIHKSFITMGIDAVLYINQGKLIESSSSLNSYANILKKREIKNILFVTKKKEEYEILIAPFSGTTKFIEEGEDVFYLKNQNLTRLLLNLGKDLIRMNQPQKNFLILEKPTILESVSIVDNWLLKNYPGILRTSKLAVERFSYLDTTMTEDATIQERIHQRNAVIKKQNCEMETIMELYYPFKWVMVDRMSDDDLKKKRYQFVLRSLNGNVESVRKMFNYEVLPTEMDFESIIPMMPNQKKEKRLLKGTLVYKFYMRQTVTKNLHIGKWDAAISWQEALKNMIGNLDQELNIKN